MYDDSDEQQIMESKISFSSHFIQIMSSEVERSIKELTLSYKRDHCALVRSACAFIVHVSQDEHRLYYQFFNHASSQLV